MLLACLLFAMGWAQLNTNKNVPMRQMVIMSLAFQLQLHRQRHHHHQEQHNLLRDEIFVHLIRPYA